MKLMIQCLVSVWEVLRKLEEILILVLILGTTLPSHALTAEELLSELDEEPAVEATIESQTREVNDKKNVALSYKEKGLSCSATSDCPMLAECMGYIQGVKFGSCVCGYKDGCYKQVK